MGGHKVGNEILFFADFFIYLIEFVAEFLINIKPRLSHIGKNLGGDVLGCDLQLT